MAEATPERLTVGLVRGLHGLRGAVRVESLTDHSTRFDPGSVLFIDGDDRPLTVAWSGASKPGLLMRFEEVPTREAAEGLRDHYLEALIDQPLPKGSFYWHQIEGLTVRTVDGEDLGIVADVFRAGEAEVYVVQGGARGEILVPALADVVTELDPEGGTMTVDGDVLALDKIPPRRLRKRHARTAGAG